MSRLSILFGLVLFLSTTAAWSIDCRHDDNNLKCVEYIHNYDGDTVTVDIPKVHALLGSRITIRVNGVDTAEMSSDDDCEKDMALRAQSEVERVLIGARRIELRNVQRGKYFRIVADVYVNGRSLANRLLKKDLAVPYDGGTKADVDWCTL